MAANNYLPKCVQRLRDNQSAYDRYKIRPRVLRNVSNLDTSTEIFGQKVTFPLGISPSAMHRLAHPEGEVATSRGAANMGVAMCLSSYSNTSLEDVAKQGKGNPYIMQVCVVKDRDITLQLLKRAESKPHSLLSLLIFEVKQVSDSYTDAGYRALFLSVDVPALGRRLNEMRNDFTLPEDLSFPNILSNGHEEFTSGDGGMAYG